MSRVWAMPNKNTFEIKPIAALLSCYLDVYQREIWVDPFVGYSPFASWCIWTNDLNPDIPATHHMESLDFLATIETGVCDGVLFDPPYSPRQISESYKGVGKGVSSKDTESSWWGNRKKEIARITRVDGLVISCGWNSGGIGKTQGFEIVEILLVAHGGWHNDTIVTVERKVRDGNTTG